LINHLLNIAYLLFEVKRSPPILQI
jgi:hypothetical protein